MVQFENPIWPQILSAVFCGVSALLQTINSKYVLTTYNFPSFQVLSLTTILLITITTYIAKKLKYVEYPDLNMSTIRKIFPLPLFYFGFTVLYLGSVKYLSLPMSTVLRRFIILMTMIAELLVLRIKPSISVQICVYVMIIGAIIAAVNDLSFNLLGYILAFSSNFSSAAYTVIIKKKLNSQELNIYGILFYNALFIIIPTAMIAWLTGDVEKAISYENWNDVYFILLLSISIVLSCMLIFSALLCTQYNSALTTMIVSCLKDNVITYLGMFIGGDYIFNLLNFIGLNISVLASFFYIWVAFKSKKATTKDETEPNESDNQTREV